MKHRKMRLVPTQASTSNLRLPPTYASLSLSLSLSLFLFNFQTPSQYPFLSYILPLISLSPFLSLPLSELTPTTPAAQLQHPLKSLRWVWCDFVGALIITQLGFNDLVWSYIQKSNKVSEYSFWLWWFGLLFFYIWYLCFCLSIYSRNWYMFFFVYMCLCLSIFPFFWGGSYGGFIN